MTDAVKEAEAEAEIEAEIVPAEKPEDEFPWAQSDDERRRSFIFVQLSDGAGQGLSVAEIDGRILVENMHIIDLWLKDGEVTKRPEPKIKSVNKNG